MMSERVRDSVWDVDCERVISCVRDAVNVCRLALVLVAEADWVELGVGVFLLCDGRVAVIVAVSEIVALPLMVIEAVTEVVSLTDIVPVVDEVADPRVRDTVGVPVSWGV